MSKSNFEQARDAEALRKMEEYQKLQGLVLDPTFSGFCYGADWGAAYERERAAKLVQALKHLKHLNHHKIEEELWRIQEALNAYESEQT